MGLGRIGAFGTICKLALYALALHAEKTFHEDSARTIRIEPPPLLKTNRRRESLFARLLVMLWQRVGFFAPFRKADPFSFAFPSPQYWISPDLREAPTLSPALATLPR
jgi:hypothetical protein